MNYTIMVLEDIFNDLEVILEKDGNTYLVGLYHKRSKEYTHKNFDTLEGAMSMFNKYSTVIATGDYSYDERKSWLE